MVRVGGICVGRRLLGKHGTCMSCGVSMAMQ